MRVIPFVIHRTNEAILVTVHNSSILRRRGFTDTPFIQDKDIKERYKTKYTYSHVQISKYSLLISKSLMIDSNTYINLVK